MPITFVKPDWPLSDHVHALTTTRQGGVSHPPFDSLNLATHVHDNPADVTENRHRLKTELLLPNDPFWLNQQHTNRVINLDETNSQDADGSYTAKKDIICCVLTADCLPILLSDKSGTEVAAIHAGWRGLASGIIDNGIKHFKHSPKELFAWIGPAISRDHYEIDNSVRSQFLHNDIDSAPAFIPSRTDHWRLDLPKLAKQYLKKCGITQIYGGDYCTFSDVKRFYSYRRDGGKTGRIATLIWLS